MSSKTTQHMTWHHSHDMVNGVMMHHFDGEAWNILILYILIFIIIKEHAFGLRINGLNPFRLFVALYSCWPIILTVYNFPPEMCMRLEFMFLSIVILSFNSLGQNIDVCLWPLINDLKQLWSFWALTYDVSRKQNF